MNASKTFHALNRASNTAMNSLYITLFFFLLLSIKCSFRCAMSHYFKCITIAFHMSVCVNISLLVSLHVCIFSYIIQYGVYSNVIFTWGFIRILNFNQNTMKHAMFNEAKPTCTEPKIKEKKTTTTTTIKKRTRNWKGRKDSREKIEQNPYKSKNLI